MNAITFEKIPNGLMENMMRSEKYIKSLDLIEYSLLELMRYQVSVLNDCAYCVDMHYKEAIAAGESDQRLYLVKFWRESDFYTDTEKALLAWAEYVTQLNGGKNEREVLFKNLEQHFSTEQIVNITFSIVQINSWNRLMKPFGFKPAAHEMDS